MISSSTRSSRPSLLPTCQYSDAAPAPSSSPSRRMLSAGRPSRSSRSIAAFTIASRLIGSRPPPGDRAGRRRPGGGGGSRLLLLPPPPPLSHTLPLLPHPFSRPPHQ